MSTIGLNKAEFELLAGIDEGTVENSSILYKKMLSVIAKSIKHKTFVSRYPKLAFPLVRIENQSSASLGSLPEVINNCLIKEIGNKYPYLKVNNPGENPVNLTLTVNKALLQLYIFGEDKQKIYKKVNTIYRYLKRCQKSAHEADIGISISMVVSKRTREESQNLFFHIDTPNNIYLKLAVDILLVPSNPILTLTNNCLNSLSNPEDTGVSSARFFMELASSRLNTDMFYGYAGIREVIRNLTSKNVNTESFNAEDLYGTFFMGECFLYADYLNSVVKNITRFLNYVPAEACIFNT